MIATISRRMVHFYSLYHSLVRRYPPPRTLSEFLTVFQKYFPFYYGGSGCSEVNALYPNLTSGKLSEVNCALSRRRWRLKIALQFVPARYTRTFFVISEVSCNLPRRRWRFENFAPHFDFLITYKLTH